MTDINNQVLIEKIKTLEMMKKHGLYWYNFDENSGNAIDSKGSSYVGTLSNVTRVQGWDNEGYALDFNGSSLVTFNNNLMTYGEKTIVLRFKTISNNNMYLFENYATTNVNQSGYNLLIDQGQVILRRSISTGGVAVYSFTLTSPATYNDGNWHTVLFSWTGDINQKANLYIDGILVASDFSTASETPSNFGTQNMSIGGCKLRTWRQYFTGQIDDFQYYNKALTPEDFTLNKTLILCKNKYMKYGNKAWTELGYTSPTSTNFINDGFEVSTLNRSVQTLNPQAMTQDTTWSEGGKVFKKSIDLKKYFDIRSINITN